MQKHGIFHGTEMGKNLFFLLQFRTNCATIYFCKMRTCAQTLHRETMWRFPDMFVFVAILQLLCGLALVLAVLFQSGKSSGLSSVIGGGDSFLSKNKAKSLDAKLARATKWIGAAFLILTIILLILG